MNIFKEILLVYLILIDCSNLQSVSYLQKLIKLEVDKTKNFRFQNDNRAFFQNVTDNNIYDYGEFDFVIVGAGSAGAVVANRLSEINTWNILLLEAGGSEDDFSDIPEMNMFLALSNKSWNYNSTAQKACCSAHENGQLTYPRGKIVGGSSAINACIYVRGNRGNFDAWAALGNKGWSYEDVLPYFMKAENATFPGDDGYAGHGGPCSVSHIRPLHPAAVRYMKAARQLGHKVLEDYNGRQQLGVSQIQSTINRGRRASSGRAYLEPIVGRRNLKISLNSFVTKVILAQTPSNIEAKAVVFVKDGRFYSAKATKEVILSAGSINTPQILMLSGIGPKEVLAKVNITTIKELPVGQNLQDHPMVPLSINTNRTVDQRNLKQELWSYLRGAGELTAATNARLVDFHSTTNGPTADLQLTFSPPNQTPLQVTPPGIFNYRADVEASLLSKLKQGASSTIIATNVQPHSRGQVTLKSDLPVDFPNIDVGFLSDQRDVEVLYQGVRYIQKLVRTEAYRAVNATLAMPTDFVLCRHHVPDSKDYWYCFVRSVASTLFHPVSTTAMGPNATGAVVDAALYL